MSTPLPPTKSTILKEATRAYLTKKPFFYGFIRPQEVYFFRAFSHLISSGTVLDFGADDGFFASLALPGHSRLIGLDLPGTGLNSPLAKKIYATRHTYNGSTIPLKSNSVDHLISNCVLEHVTDIKLSLSEHYRVIKPGGFALHTVMSSQWNQNLLGGKLVGKPYLNWLARKQVHRQLHSHARWFTLFQESGFQIHAVYGYLNPTVSKLLELSHYLALPQLILHHLTGSWTPLNSPTLSHSLTRALTFFTQKDVFTPPDQASALCLILKKPSSH
jgi:2-polyprenyl-3-methyl-5-hydroxy-6-metoxy-1,4-benzoquinol methylase